MVSGEDAGEREERPKTKAFREIATLNINDKKEDAKFANMIMLFKGKYVMQFSN